MPMRRRRVYWDHSYSRRDRMESWLSISIYLSGAVLLLSMLGCLPDIISSTVSWLLPAKLSHRPGGLSANEQVSPLLTSLCGFLMVLSGV